MLTRPLLAIRRLDRRPVTGPAAVRPGHFSPDVPSRAISPGHNSDVLLSAIGRLLLPALDFGTVYLLTSGLPRHSQHFVGS